MGKIYLNGNGYGGLCGPSEGDRISATQILNQGTHIATLYVNDTTIPLYAPPGAVNDVKLKLRSTDPYTSVLDQDGNANIDLSSSLNTKQDKLTAGSHITISNSNIISATVPSITVTPTYTEGIPIGTIQIDDNTTSLFVPSNTIEGIRDVQVNDQTVVNPSNSIAFLYDVTGATELEDGIGGMVPAPLTTDIDKFLKGDGTWGTPPSGSEITITPSTVNTGATIADITIDESTYTLRAPAETVQAITFNNNPVTITSGTASIISPVMTGASSSTDGESGLVPTPTTASVDKFLRGDGAWATPPSGGSSVEITPTLSTGTKIAEYEIDGVSGDLYAPSGGGSGSTVSITPSLSTGTKIADFEIDGSSGSLFAPAGGGGTTAYGGTTPPAASLGNNGDFYYQYDSIEDEMTMTFYVKLNNAWRKILTPSGGENYYTTNAHRTTVTNSYDIGMEGVINAN